jgi:thiamine pyrophosphate-dependent acetolactate synthase large subunit-like protein
MFRAEVQSPHPAAIDVPVAAAPDEAIDRAAELLANSQCPIAVAGMGAFRGGSRGSADDAFAEFGIPVLGNASGRGLVGEDDRGGFSWPYAQIAAKHADCVLVVGETLTQRLGFGLPPRFARDAQFVQIDGVAESFGRNRRTDVALLGEPAPTLEALMAALRKREVSAKAAWLADALTERAALFDRLARDGAPTLHPLALGRALQARLAGGTMLIGDGADIQNWMYAVLRVRRRAALRIITHWARWVPARLWLSAPRRPWPRSEKMRRRSSSPATARSAFTVRSSMPPRAPG